MAQPISNPRAWREWRLFFLVAPALLMVALFAYLPAVSAVFHSFFSWQGGTAKQWLGLGNFRRAFQDRILWHSFGTVLLLMVFNLFKIIPSIALAVLIHRMRSERWQYFYRSLLVVPMIVPHLVTLFIWKFFFDPNFGVLNRILDLTGGKSVLVTIDHALGWGIFMPHTPIAWLSQPELILPSLFIWGFPWIGSVGVLIYLAGLQSISPDIYEAAEMEGVGPFGKFIYIELPLILTQIRLTLVLLVIATLQGYGLILLLLGDTGGPAGKGMVPGLWMYNRAFTAGEFGYACAIGIVLFSFISVLTWLNHKYIRIEK